MVKCPICEKPLGEWSDYMGSVLIEEEGKCPGHYTEHFLTGCYQVSVGDKTFQWSDQTPDEEYFNIQYDIADAITKLKNQVKQK